MDKAQIKYMNDMDNPQRYSLALLGRAITGTSA